MHGHAMNFYPKYLNTHENGLKAWDLRASVKLCKDLALSDRFIPIWAFHFTIFLF